MKKSICSIVVLLLSLIRNRPIESRSSLNRRRSP